MNSSVRRRNISDLAEGRVAVLTLPQPSRLFPSRPRPRRSGSFRCCKVFLPDVPRPGLGATGRLPEMRDGVGTRSRAGCARSGKVIRMCPMHAQVQRDRPCDSPKCDMGLVLQTPTGAPMPEPARQPLRAKLRTTAAPVDADRLRAAQLSARATCTCG